MRSFALALFLSAAAASPAHAQDDASAPFTGPRVEGLVGWDRVQANDDHDDAIGYGVGVGYDMQMGGAVVGVEAEYSDSDNRTCVGARTVADPRICVKSGRDLYAGARVGTLVTPSMLLYAKAGYTNAQAKLTSDDGTDQITLDKTKLDGIRVGGGAEYALGTNSFAKAEYRYSNYEQGVERHQVMGGFGFRF
jgi:outer membrane immunogenic protein